MPTYVITLERVVIADSAADAINLFFDRTKGSTATRITEQVDTPDPAPKTLTQKVVATTTALVKEAGVQAGIVEKTPICPDHQVAMQTKPSKFGQGKFYFSCPVKLDDGRYCRAKPR